MKLLKRIFIGLGILILALLITAIFVKKEYTLSREVVINRPGGEVFGYIRSLRNQDQYSKWVMADPVMKKAYTGTDGTEGFVYAWNSEQDEVGEGEQEIKRIAEGEEVEWEIRFFRPFEGKAQAIMRTERISAGQTRVRWTFSSGMKYPFNLVLLFADLEDVLGKDMEASLQNLKTVLEHQEQ